MGRRETISLADDSETTLDRVPECAHLFLVLACAPARSLPARFALRAVDEVVIGRGKGPHELEGGKLVLRLDDGRVSETHARLTKRLGRWVLEDAGSKNGCVVDGERVERAMLDDGAVIEVGHTFLRFRAALPAEAPTTPGLHTLLPDLAREYQRLAQVAPSKLPVILRGETGTGKEVLARALHTLSGRGGEFVAVNCGAIPAGLVEAQLFGHKRGAFSGAQEDAPGLIRTAHAGTLFLDEIGELPAAAQASLLRVLQENEVLPVGASRPLSVDLRVVAATHRDLEGLVATDKFRRDLYMRLASLQVDLPPLRERVEDLGLLLPQVQLHPRSVRCFLAYPWPGNIRELISVVETARLLASSGPIMPEHMPAQVAASTSVELGADELRHREEIIALMRAHGGNIAAVARACGKARTQVHRWLKRYQISVEEYRK